jgi:hypothetical protein
MRSIQEIYESIVNEVKLSSEAEELLKDLYDQGADKGKKEVSDKEIHSGLVDELDNAGLIVTHKNNNSPLVGYVTLTKDGIKLAKKL